MKYNGVRGGTCVVAESGGDAMDSDTPLRAILIEAVDLSEWIF